LFGPTERHEWMKRIATETERIEPPPPPQRLPTTKPPTPKPPVKKTYTTQEWIQKTHTEQEEADIALSELKRQEREIDPTQYYYVGEDRDRYMKGIILKGHLQKDIESVEKYQLMAQRQAGEARGMFAQYPGATIVRTPEGYTVKRDIVAEQQREWRKLSPFQQFGKALFVGATEWPSAIVGAVTGADVQRQLIEKEAVTWKHAQRVHKGDITPFIADVGLSPAMTHVVYPGVIGISAGAGIGAVKAVSVGAGTVAETELLVQSIHHIGKSVYEEPVGTLVSLGISMPFVIPGYRVGHRFGYGRTEAYLYGKHTYKPGSAELIRFKSALKVSRRLQNVRSLKMRPLDITRDIMRMDPRTTIGGSAASRTQIIGARQPRDLDIFVRRRLDVFLGSKKEIVSAKKYIGKIRTPTGKHLVDIHGTEMFKPGRYHRFGFVSKKPVRIGEFKFFRAGEQLFRKAVASVTKEAQYRWFKDIPDFITYAKSQIVSAKKHWWTYWKGVSGKKHLDLFLHPEKAPSYGKVTGWDKFIQKYVKPAPQPKAIVMPGGYVDYIYPSGMYPSYYTGAAIGGYVSTMLAKSYMPTPQIGYKPSIFLDYKPGVIQFAPSYPKKLGKIVYPTVSPSGSITGYTPTLPVSTYPTAPSYVGKPSPPTYPVVPSYTGKPYPGYAYGYTPSTPRPSHFKKSDIGKKIVRQPDQGYQVMVKTRQYVRGKPVGSEKFRPLTRVAYNYGDSMSLLGSALDHSIAQKGFIKPVDRPPKRLKRRIPSRWGGIRHKFYLRQGKWTEDRIHAIDQPGEVRELNAYQWLRGLPKKQIEKEFGLPSMSFDMYGFDRMQISFNKMLRRLRM